MVTSARDVQGGAAADGCSSHGCCTQVLPVRSPWKSFDARLTRLLRVLAMPSAAQRLRGATSVGSNISWAHTHTAPCTQLPARDSLHSAGVLPPLSSLRYRFDSPRLPILTAGVCAATESRRQGDIQRGDDRATSFPREPVQAEQKGWFSACLQSLPPLSTTASRGTRGTGGVVADGGQLRQLRGGGGWLLRSQFFSSHLL
jgi:hypothetical protein